MRTGSGSDIGSRMKFYEDLTVDQHLMPMVPVLARIDGRAFHTFCRDLPRPFDVRLHGLMVNVTKFLVEETQALVGYTQSDEISLLWYSDNFDNQIYFDGRVFKMASTLAALATAKFTRLLPSFLPEKADSLPIFDARVWTVPNQTEAANYFLWREMDAVRNSINGAGQARFTHAELHGKNTNQVQEMLWQKCGINWAKYHPWQKRGSWVRKVQTLKAITIKDIDRLPLKHHARTNPDFQVNRWEVREVDMPRFGSVQNREAVIFANDAPDGQFDEDPNAWKLPLDSDDQFEQELAEGIHQ